MTNFILELLFVRLRDLIILAVDTTEITVTKKDVARTFRTYQTGLFAEMRCVRRNDRKTSGIACGNFIVQPVVQTIARTNGATLQQCLERLDTLKQFTGLQKA